MSRHLITIPGQTATLTEVLELHPDGGTILVESGKMLRVPSGATERLPVDYELSVEDGGLVSVEVGASLEILGGLNAGRHPVFTGGGSVVGNHASAPVGTSRQVLPHWFGVKTADEVGHVPSMRQLRDQSDALQRALTFVGTAGGTLRLTADLSPLRVVKNLFVFGPCSIIGEPIGLPADSCQTTGELASSESFVVLELAGDFGQAYEDIEPPTYAGGPAGVIEVCKKTGHLKYWVAIGVPTKGGCLDPWRGTPGIPASIENIWFRTTATDYTGAHMHAIHLMNVLSAEHFAIRRCRFDLRPRGHRDRGGSCLVALNDGDWGTYSECPAGTPGDFVRTCGIVSNNEFLANSSLLIGHSAIGAMDGVKSSLDGAGNTIPGLEIRNNCMLGFQDDAINVIGGSESVRIVENRCTSTLGAIRVSNCRTVTIGGNHLEGIPGQSGDESSPFCSWPQFGKASIVVSDAVRTDKPDETIFSEDITITQNTIRAPGGPIGRAIVTGRNNWPYWDFNARNDDPICSQLQTQVKSRRLTSSDKLKVKIDGQADPFVVSFNNVLASDTTGFIDWTSPNDIATAIGNGSNSSGRLLKDVADVAAHTDGSLTIASKTFGRDSSVELLDSPDHTREKLGFRNTDDWARGGPAGGDKMIIVEKGVDRCDIIANELRTDVVDPLEQSGIFLHNLNDWSLTGVGPTTIIPALKLRNSSIRDNRSTSGPASTIPPVIWEGPLTGAIQERLERHRTLFDHVNFTGNIVGGYRVAGQSDRFDHTNRLSRWDEEATTVHGIDTGYRDVSGISLADPVDVATFDFNGLHASSEVAATHGIRHSIRLTKRCVLMGAEVNFSGDGIRPDDVRKIGLTLVRTCPQSPRETTIVADPNFTVAHTDDGGTDTIHRMTFDLLCATDRFCPGVLSADDPVDLLAMKLVGGEGLAGDHHGTVRLFAMPLPVTTAHQMMLIPLRGGAIERIHALRTAIDHAIDRSSLQQWGLFPPEYVFSSSAFDPTGASAIMTLLVGSVHLQLVAPNAFPSIVQAIESMFRDTGIRSTFRQVATAEIDRVLQVELTAGNTLDAVLVQDEILEKVLGAVSAAFLPAIPI